MEIIEAKSFQHQCAENVEKFDKTKFDFQVIFLEKILWGNDLVTLRLGNTYKIGCFRYLTEF